MSSDIKLRNLEDTTRRIFQQTFTAWANRNLEVALRYIADDAVHSLNVDGDIAPFAASTVGKPQMREKLQLILDTFEFRSFVTDYLAVSGNIARARMKLIYIHKLSRERLKTSFRFVITQQDGLITRINEYHDAPYLEAFARLTTPSQGI